MNIKQLKKRLWKSWTWRQRLSYLWQRYNYFSDHAKEMRELTKELKELKEISRTHTPTNH